MSTVKQFIIDCPYEKQIFEMQIAV